MITPFRHFIRHLHLLFDDATLSTTQRQQQATQLLKTLVQQHSWLPRAYAEPDPDRYRQMLLYADLHERFSVLSFIWGPGQQTPIHDHGVWGLVGVLRGAEIDQRYKPAADGSLHLIDATTLNEGDVSLICPRQGDIHAVKNAYEDQVSISIHLYASNIGRIDRQLYENDGTTRPFISRYQNASVPNLWFEDSDSM
ncbi:cysteine dioxygenase [Paenalcaligenes niemegkensis]|uniref:cysteine dioxygenase family protein n=1 Tax=Paenalcaligenes niemegkensis TaxID=2895469 RepID=UPI001EE955B5|nr:cysteine dioxygenase [Paenalcaligenes niemegkensis]MCQ9618183.1 cysteine dioxygenase [Paenalcaligenes niemegkensis]